MFSTIKNYFLNKYLSGNKPNRKIQLVPLAQAKNIGILCEITDEDSYKAIFSIFTQLQDAGHNVKLMGYVNEKEVPFYCLPQLTADYFCNKHLNWYGLPIMEQIQDALKVDYDMLIDFNYRYHGAVKSFLSLSNARLIVGRVTEYQACCDLFFNAPEADYRDYLNVIINYTQKLSGNDR